MDSEKPEENNIYEIFDLVQQSSACHLKYALQLKKTFEKHNTNDLLDDLSKCLQFAFLTDFKEKNIFLERIINFTALFSVSFKPDKTDDVVHPILSHIFRFILKLSNSPNPAHRYWSCKLFNKMFHDMEELSDELYEEIKEAMFERFRDPKSVIRCQAIIALHRLQDPTDPQDPIICRLCAMLDSDFNSKVRQLCLEKIAFNKHTMPFVLNRIRDVDANVRLTVFQKLCSIAKYLKVSQVQRKRGYFM
jgi:condensin complex subunit 3